MRCTHLRGMDACAVQPCLVFMFSFLLRMGDWGIRGSGNKARDTCSIDTQISRRGGVAWSSLIGARKKRKSCPGLIPAYQRGRTEEVANECFTDMHYLPTGGFLMTSENDDCRFSFVECMK